MKLKETYEEARLQIIRFDGEDIVTASNIATDGDDSSGEGWTPLGW